MKKIANMHIFFTIFQLFQTRFQEHLYTHKIQVYLEVSPKKHCLEDIQLLMQIEVTVTLTEQLWIGRSARGLQDTAFKV